MHCFTAGGEVQQHLHDICEEVHYYKRRKGVRGLSLNTPYIVSSRYSADLEQRLLNDSFPILLEGIHCTGLLTNPRLNNRKIIIRLHNVEHIYYNRLISHTSSFFKKLYFIRESSLLKIHEKKIARSPHKLVAVAVPDRNYYADKLGAKNIDVLSVFTGFEFSVNTGIGEYCLYHGNLSVPENQKAVCWLLDTVFMKLPVPIVIAGKNPSSFLKQKITSNPSATLISNPSSAELHKIIANAQVHVLPSLNATGVKLKLIHALFNGRHCVVNSAAVEGTGLQNICTLANTPEEFIKAVSKKFAEAMLTEELEVRKSLLLEQFDNKKNAAMLIQWIW